MSGLRRPAGLFAGIVAALLMAAQIASPIAHAEPEKIVGPNACAECHKDETAVWKETHHFKTFNTMHRSKAARAIAKKLGLKRIKSESLCLGCHFTQTKKRGQVRATAGISCESCHGAGKDWLKVHSEFSGNKDKSSETDAEEAARWKKSEAAGMLRPRALYDLAKNCYGCHVVPEEELVNVGEHAAGSPFELLAWSQGEIRHILWYSKGKTNDVANEDRKRMLYLVGLAVEIETALRAVAKATKSAQYSIRMAHRADKARKAMLEAAKALPDVGELRRIVEASHAAGLKLDNEAALNAAADSIAENAKALAANHDGSRFAAIDRLLPDPAKYKGTPAKSGKGKSARSEGADG